MIYTIISVINEISIHSFIVVQRETMVDFCLSYENSLVYSELKFLQV